MKRKLKISLIFLSSVFLFSACKKSGDETAQANQAVNQGPVIATIGSSSITVEDFNTKFSSIPQQFRMYFNGDEGKKRFLDELIREKLFVEQALRLGLDKDPVVQKTISQMRDSIISKKLYEMKNEEFTRTAQVTDAEIENEIKGNTIASAAHILIKDEAKAKEALKRVKKGEDIQKLAGELSEDPAGKRNGGLLGTFSRGEMVPEFEQAVFALKIGETTPNLVKSKFGNHIIKRVEPNKDEVRNNLNRKKQMELFDKWFESLKKEMAVKINDEEFKKVSLEAPVSMPGMPSGHPSVPQAQEPEVPGHEVPQHPAATK